MSTALNAGPDAAAFGHAAPSPAVAWLRAPSGQPFPGRLPNRAAEYIETLPRQVALLDAKQIEARVEVWATSNPPFAALLLEGAPPAQALRRLALTHWSAGNPRLASSMLATAAAIAPGLPELWLDLGFTLQAIAERADASVALEIALALDPAPARAWLGLAVISNELEDKSRAETAFAMALEREPGLSEAAFGLGLICFEQRRYGEAARHFRAAIEAGCQNGLVHVGLGQSLFFIGDFAGAARALEPQLAAGPAEASLAQRYGLVRYLDAAIAGDLERAEALYIAGAGPHAQSLAEVARSAFQILSGYGHRAAALKIGHERLADGGHDPVQRYLFSAVAGRKIQRAPSDYLVAYFDHFAEGFDKQLIEVLGYRVPEELMKLLPARTKSWPRAADLGCGTGLAGPLLRPRCRRLVGVDLSPRMLEKAARRNAYDGLIEADIVAWLAETQERFDLVMAADTLVYFGDLTEFFAATARVTEPGALLAFNVETTTNAPYELLPSGRFAHEPRALIASAAPAFQLVEQRRAILRTEANRKVEGTLLLLRRR